MHNLANAVADRIGGERADNLERAIDYYKQVLEVKTRQAGPKAWAETINELATAYTNRIRGERALNQEQAIAYYEQAIAYYEQTIGSHDTPSNACSLGEDDQ